MRHGGLVPALITGGAIFVVIVCTHFLIGRRWIDKDHLHDFAFEVGLNSRSRYGGMMIYWIFVNSVIEEYVWRWFVFRKCQMLMPAAAAMVTSAAAFTLHHVLALAGFFPWPLTLLGSIGVFIGGATWS